jgi:hypothetical protein
MQEHDVYRPTGSRTTANHYSKKLERLRVQITHFELFYLIFVIETIVCWKLAVGIFSGRTVHGDHKNRVTVCTFCQFI